MAKSAKSKQRPLDDRKQQVLKAVVDDYTVTAIPVGSQVLAARYFGRWSSATIRNELAHLMETGHLEQPHTSAGRIPSNRGYRYFVDYLMKEPAVDVALGTRLQRHFDNLPLDIEAILEGTAMALAQEVENVGVVTAPRTSESRLKHVDLIHLDGRRVLAVVVLEGNVVRQQPLEAEQVVTQAELETLSARINHEAAGSSDAELRSWLEEQKLQSAQAALVTDIAEFMSLFDAQSATVVVHDGVRNLVKQPEFLESDKLFPVLELLEHSRELVRVLEATAAGEDIGLLIGEENADAHLRECSVVMTTYQAASTRGTLGTIGPTRMQYPQVVARVRIISRMAGETIARLYS
jgi:heat-inducible transcriptional repressor